MDERKEPKRDEKENEKVRDLPDKKVDTADAQQVKGGTIRRDYQK